MPSKEQIDKLKELAEKATPGPWWSGNCDPADGHALAWIGTHFVETEHRVPYESQEADAAYIAAANPAVVSELIAMLEAAQKDAVRYRWLTAHAYIGECFTDKGKVLEVQNCDREVPMREYAGYGHVKVDAAIDAAIQSYCDGSHHERGNQ